MGAGKWLLEWLQGVWRAANETVGSAMRNAKGSELVIASLEKMMVKECESFGGPVGWEQIFSFTTNCCQSLCSVLECSVMETV